MEKEDMKIVIVGHVDHGKSTLIGRLFFDTDSLPKEKKREIESICKDKGKDVEFAFVMDHLEEERDQGITIDTAQTFFKTKKRNYVIIDAPGHKEFLKNMITGASQAEVAILIVDGHEGVQEQTRRHAYILSFLGIEQVIVVINKMDLVEYSEEIFENVKEKLLSFLKKINIKSSYVIPISSKQGDNVSKKSKSIDWYKGKTILESLDTFYKQEASNNKPLRFPVQDVYKIDDKRITVGKVESGMLEVGEEIVFLPTKKKTKIKSIEVFEKKKGKAESGESVGITTTESIFIERGEIVCKASESVKLSDEFKAEVFCMSKKPIKTNEEITLRCTTQEVKCSIKRVLRKINSSTLKIINEDVNELKETETGEVIIKTKKPVVIEKFKEIPELGRFVFVRNSNTVAGGIVREVI
ncbi:MAG: GTP-binding protein [DPANN group archaeon]|nr:GTP-binding protein [DPANN group archaeon]